MASWKDGSVLAELVLPCPIQETVCCLGPGGGDGLIDWEVSHPALPSYTMDIRRRRILLTILVVVIAVVVGGSVAGALVSFPASLLIPLLLMAVATALFYIWA
jgi:hypothetical protein